MERDISIDRILKDAQTITKLNNEIMRTFESRSESEDAYQAWSEACRIFHDSYNDLAFPGGLEQGLALLKKGDSETIETAITYLEANPYYFRSGYIKEKILRLLKQATLTKKQIGQLQDILINVIQRTGRRENREYRRLAQKIADDKFRARLQKIIQDSNDPRIIERAQHMLDGLNEG